MATPGHSEEDSSLFAEPNGLRNPCSFCKISAARSPITTQGAMVLPEVIRGRIDPVSNPKILDTVNLEIAIMPVDDGSVPNKPIKFLQRSRVADFSAQIHTRNRRLEIIRMREKTRIESNHRGRVRSNEDIRDFSDV